MVPEVNRQSILVDDVIYSKLNKMGDKSSVSSKNISRGKKKDFVVLQPMAPNISP